MNMIEFDNHNCLDMERVTHFWLMKPKADDRIITFGVKFIIFGSDLVCDVPAATPEEAEAIYRVFISQTNTRNVKDL